MSLNVVNYAIGMRPAFPGPCIFFYSMIDPTHHSVALNDPASGSAQGEAYDRSRFPEY